LTLPAKYLCYFKRIDLPEEVLAPQQRRKSGIGLQNPLAVEARLFFDLPFRFSDDKPKIEPEGGALLRGIQLKRRRRIPKKGGIARALAK
jgi:hypothetical protein